MLTFIACPLNLRQAAHIKSAIKRNGSFSHLFDNTVNLLRGGLRLVTPALPWWDSLALCVCVFFFYLVPGANSLSKPLHLHPFRVRQSTCAKWNVSTSHVSPPVLFSTLISPLVGCVPTHQIIGSKYGRLPTYIT